MIRITVPFRSFSSRRLLLAGVSVLGLLVAIQPAQAAQSVKGRASAPAAAAVAAAQGQQAAASAAAARSQALLSRALKSYKDRGDLQALKRAQALAGPNQIIVNGALVTLGNGLYDAVNNPTGGLKPHPDIVVTPTGEIKVVGGNSYENPIPTSNIPEGSKVWIGADGPTETVADGHYTVTVKQNQQKAILTWESFDIGKDTTLYFDQTKGGADVANWIALNRVMDSGLAPSKILGNIKADGQVYVINKNGVIFGGSSQVNVHTLVASSLNFSNAQFAAGIAKPLSGFQNGGDSWAIPTFGDHADSIYTGSVGSVTYGDAPGDVEVREGALIGTKSGGKAMLFAPHVINAGTIKAPEGQVILAAGENVWLMPQTRDPATQQVDTSARGLDVAVSAASPYLLSGAVLSYAMGYRNSNYGPLYTSAKNVIFPAMMARAESVGYRAVNSGVIEAEHGNITMQALNVEQRGTLFSSTALNNREGSIVLRAWGQGGLDYNDDGATLWAQAGTLTIGADSTTLVLPDLSDTSTIEQSSVATRYKAGSITLRGKLIDIESKANLVVPAGRIDILASTDTRSNTESGASTVNPINDGSRIYVGEDALLSVAGITDVLLAMESNVVKGEFRINELRDSPLYRDSWLRGASVYIDKRKSGSFSDGPMAGVEWGGDRGEWTGTALGDMSAWIGTGITSLAELSSTGGSILLKSGGDIITRSGALLDISGGSVTYAPGWITTTKLVRADGRTVDIGDANPNEIYIGIANGTTRVSTRWGVVESYASKTHGRGQGRWEAGYTEGRDAGSLTILNGAGLAMEGDIVGGVVTSENQAVKGNVAKGGTLTIGGSGKDDRLWLGGTVIISDSPVRLGDTFTSTTSLPTTFLDPSESVTSGKTTWIDSKTLNDSELGSINIYFYKGFELAEGASLDLMPGTKFTAAANNGSATGVAATVNGTIRSAGGTITISGGESLHLGAHARLDVAGQTVNDYAASTHVMAPVVKGGTVNLGVMSTGAVTVEDGAAVDVSGGLWLSDRGGKPKMATGDAGTLGLGNISNADLARLDMRAFSAGSGGSLSFTTGVGVDVQLGGTDPGLANVLYLPANLYGDRGFRSVSVTAMGEVRVPDGAAITQMPVSVDLARSSLTGFQTGTAITDIGTVRVLETNLRADRKPTSLSIDTISGNSITIGTGAVVTTDIGGSISLQTGSSTGSVRVDGTLDTPAGRISLVADTIILSDTARLTARGIPVISVDPVTGMRQGFVRNGGSVSLEAGSKFEIAQNAVIDVSGSSGVIDQASGRSFAPMTLVSNGGAISITGAGEVKGKLLARAGGAGGVGGTLSLRGAAVDGQRPDIPNLLLNFDPDNLGYPGDGQYDGADAIGFDLRQVFIDWGYGDPGGPMILTQGLIDALSADPYTILITGGTAGGGGTSRSLADFGWSDGSVAALRDFFGIDLASMLASTNPPTMVVRPATIDAGGFSGLTIDARAGTIGLKDAVVHVNGTMTLMGTLRNEGGSSSLSADYIRLSSSLDMDPRAGGDGRLSLNASTIDIANAAIRGFAISEFVAKDILLSGLDLQNQRDTASLDSDGHLILKAGAIYPVTAVTATIRAGDKITVEQNGSAGQVLSAGGALILEAPEIAQNGTLLAPFGSITLKSTDSVSGKVTLGAGSVTSVSGAGTVVPYGNLRNGEEWIAPDATYDTKAGQSVATGAPPEKRITLDARSIEQADGALVDISGGGDLTAWEHVPGPGGSHDVLAMSGVYAILPSQAGAVSSSGERVWLAGGNGLAAGWYTLLPAHYALLPGAFAVQLVSGTTGNAVGSVALQNDGSVLMAGKAGNVHTGASDQQTSTWRVMSGGVVRSYSEYNEASANSFFASDTFKLTQYRLTGQNVVTPRLPMDGGAVVYKAVTSLIMDGALKSAAASGGRGGMVDIAAAKIVVAGAGQDTSDLAGYLVLDATRLSGFGAESLMLGGVRSGTSQGTTVDVVAENVVVRNDAGTALVGPELIFVARDELTIADGSVLRVAGNIVSDGDLIMNPAVPAVWSDNGTSWTKDDDYIKTPARDYGALIRLSNGAAVGVVRSNVDTSVGGHVSIGTGAVLDGGNALVIDSTRSTTLAGSAQTIARDITLGGGRIGLGGGTDGLVFDAASLSRFNEAENLTLRSHSSIDFYTGLDFGSTGLKSLTLDAGSLVGRTSDMVIISGEAVTLKNSGGTLADPGVADQTTLIINAGQLTLGSGTKAMRGFSDVNLNGTSAIIGKGTGGLDAGGANLTVSAPLLTGHEASNQNIVTTGALVVASPGTAPGGRDTDSLGSIWSLGGGSVHFGGRIDAIGGKVSLTASSGDVIVANGAVIDVGGMGKTFYDETQYVDAGSISLTAVGGDVRGVTGSILNLAGASGGGDAGTLTAVASGGGTVVLDGMIDAHAAKGKGGKFVLDIAELPDFATFGQRLSDQGFSSARSFRIRTGDVTVDGSTDVEDFTLVADAGKVTVTGSVIASKAYGGTIAITGGDGVAMSGGALLRATSTTDLGGGRVTLDAGQGVLGIVGGTIDVSGGEGGRVRFRALRENVAGSTLDATIAGTQSKVLEGVKVYTSTDGTVESQWTNAVHDANAFTAGASPINGIAVMAGIVIASNGDLSLNSDLDLSTMSGHEGGLSLRAAGNLVINGNISDGFDRADRTGVLLDQASWDIRLAAGADLAALDPLAVQTVTGLAAGKGSLIIGKRDAGGVTTGYLVRTGTGDLSVAAGRDLELIDGDSVIYTAGRKAAAVADFDAVDRWLVSGGNEYSGGTTQTRAPAVYAEKGGNLAISAGGNVKTNVPSDEGQLFTEWLWRVGATDSQGYFTTQTSWWVEPRYFRYGVGALGGGNLSLTAGGDVNDLVVVMPTNAQVSGGRFEGDSAKTLVLRNGGAMDIDVGGSILGGQYYIGRGDADIQAGALGIGRTLVVNLSSNRPTSSNPLAPILALGDARMTVTASGNMIVQTVMDPLQVDLTYDNWNLPFDQQEGIGYYTDRDALNKNPRGRLQTRIVGMTDESSLSLVSVGGDVSFGRQTQYLRRGWDDSSAPDYGENDKTLKGYWVAGTGFGDNLYPTNSRIIALNGSIDQGSTMLVLPSASSGLKMFAAENITAGVIVMGSNKPKVEYATPFSPGRGITAEIIQGLFYGRPTLDNPEHLLQENDYEPSRIYALGGSVADGNVTASEQLWIRAGRDVRRMTLRLRNLRATDTSWIDAGNDIISGTVSGYDTSFTNMLNGTVPGSIIIQGPGGLLLTAGRDVYGQDFYIYSTGNRFYDANNRPRALDLYPDLAGLPSTGASIEIIAGLNGKQPDYDAFAAAYLDPAAVTLMPDYLKNTVGGRMVPLYLTDAYDDDRDGKQLRFGLVSFVESITGESRLTPNDAWDKFQTLPQLVRERFLRQVYMQELRAAGRDQTDGGATGGYGRGYAAIATLFPGDDWSGNVQIGNALFRTMSGGDIRVMTPGGGLQAAALGTTVANDYGLVTLGYGRVDIFARDSVTVNRSRILTFAGGDEIIWSTLGDIDAGRGAKTTRVPSAPEVVIDADGVTSILEKADMSGSGIGTIEGYAGVEPGDVDLIAPEGTVNAGDAGVRVSGNLNLAARYVLNADNFDVKGEVKGLSTGETSTPTLAVDTGDEGQHAASEAVRDISRQTGPRAGNLPSIITVEVIGYGGVGGDENPQEQQRRQEQERQRRLREQHGYDMRSEVQFVGLGKLTEDEKRQLSKAEIRNLKGQD